MKKSLLKSTLLTTVLFFGSIGASYAGDLSADNLDKYVTEAMKEFNVPGIAIGIIKDGEIKHLKGYGVREIGHDAPIDADTLYAIASNSKAFTTSAMAVLVDDGILNWDDKVIDYLPNFRMIDPYVTHEFTIRDLLTHRSGLGLGAGDLMFWPSTEVTRSEIIENIRHLKMVSGFRAKYAYDNTLYVVAGEVIATASGMSFENFVQSRVINQLGMGQGCFADITSLKIGDNIAEPHVEVDGKLVKADRLQKMGEPMVIAAAGGLQCSARSLMKWVGTHLNDGAGLMSKQQHDELWSPQTILAVNSNDHKWHDTNFTAYGLGFRLKDYHGLKHISHTGGLLGMVTYITMIPKENLGIVVLTNQESGAAMSAIMENTLQDYLDSGNTDWTKIYSDMQKKYMAEAEKKIAADQSDISGKALLPLDQYAGTYRDPWFGDVTIEVKNSELYFSADKSAKLKGPLKALKFNTFSAIWENRTLKADAYVKFDLGFEGNVTGLKMEAISPLTDFSYDFHDLDFTKID